MGPSGRVISAWREASFVWVLSRSILDELERAFTYPRVRRYMEWDSSQVSEFLELLRHTAALVEPARPLTAVSRDSGDNHVLATAVAGEADYLVTNDDDLLALGSYENIEIITAARFVGVLAAMRSSQQQ